MRGVCAIVLDEDGLFLSFGSLKKGACVFLQESKVPLARKSADIVDCLRENLEAIGQRIKKAQDEHSFKVGKVFLELPYSFCGEKTVEEAVSLRRRKKITSGDISFAKKYLEDKSLNWDDFCIHNVVLEYEVEGKKYSSAPLGVWGKKIKLRSLLIWIKDKLHKEIEDIFDNLDKDFGGIVASAVSIFSASFVKREKAQVAVSVDYGRSRFTASGKDGFVFAEEFDFGLKKIIEELSKRFIFSFILAQEVFERYVSFKKIPYFKEVTVKKEGKYVNLSTQTLSSFTKNYVAFELKSLLSRVKEKVKEDDFTISFAGRLNAKEGFHSFLKDCVETELKPAVCLPPARGTNKIRQARKRPVSSSSGCLRYGVSRFLEEGHKKSAPFIQRALNIYSEYF